MPKSPKKLTDAEIIQAFQEDLNPAEQISVYSTLKSFMDEKEAERKALSDSYMKVENGK